MTTDKTPPSPPPQPVTRAAAHLEGLLSLSASLATSSSGGPLSDALDLVLAVSSSRAGCAYVARDGFLELVSHRGLSQGLRGELERLSTAERPWFVAQRAAKTRRQASDEDVSGSSDGRLAPGLLGAGFRAATAFPITSGAGVRGVVVVASGALPRLDPLAVTCIMTAANMVAIALAGDGAVDTPRPTNDLRRRATARPKAAERATATKPPGDPEDSKNTVPRMPAVRRDKQAAATVPSMAAVRRKDR